MLNLFDLKNKLSKRKLAIFVLVGAFLFGFSLSANAKTIDIGLVADYIHIPGRIGLGVTNPTLPLTIGGSGVGLTGTSTNILSLFTNSLERLTINANGNVGIGTTNPTQKLEINGTMYTGTANGYGDANYVWSQYSGMSGAITGGLKMRNGGGAVGTGISFRQTVMSSAHTDLVTILTESLGDTADFYISTTNDGSVTEKFRIMGSGNVGIGISNPASKFVVNGSAILGGATQITPLGGGGNLLVMTDNSGNLYSTTTSAVIPEAMPIGSTGQTIRHDGGAWVANSNLFNNGTNVGVGTSAPGSRLEIVDSKTHVTGDLSGADSFLRIYNSWQSDTAGKGATITFEDNYYSGSYLRTTRAAIKGGTDTIGNTANGFLAFYTDASGANSMPERMRINSSGYVGIGTTNPAYSLDVNGTIRVAQNSGYQTAGYISNFSNNYIQLYTTSGPKLTGQTNGDLTIGDGATDVNMFISGGSGNVGIGTTVAGSKLTVNGSVALGGATQVTPLGGAGNVLVMADNTGNLFSTSTSSIIPDALPAGTSGQTIRHDGADWIANSVLYNNGTNVGIGTSVPAAKLDITGGLNLTDRQYTLSGGVRTFEHVAQYHPGATPTMGTVVVTIGNTPNIMLDAEIAIQGYNGLTKCHVRGYTYISTSGWHLPAATCLGSGPVGSYSVRFGKRTSDGARVIMIGTTTTNWGNYPHVDVTRVTYGYPGTGTTPGDWSISIVTDEAAYDTIVNVSENNGFEATNPIFAGNVYFPSSGIWNSSGNVGVGTTNPTVKLAVSGATALGGATQVTPLAGAGNVIVMADNTGTLYSTSSASILAGQLWSGTKNGNIWNGDAGVGNVGVGTTNPVQKLDVTGVINASTGYRINNSAGSAGNYLRSNGSTLVLSTIQASDVPTLNQNTTGSAYYVTSRDTRAVTDIPSDYGPLIKFDFKQNTVTGLTDGGSYAGVMTWRKYGSLTDFTGGPAIQLAYSDNGNLWTRLSSSDSAWATWVKILNANTGVMLQTATPGTAQTGHINISGTALFGGNVGIGTTIPTSKLHIVGATGIINGGATQLSPLAGAGNVFVMADNTGTLYATSTAGGLGGSGTTNYLPRFTAATTVGNSVIYNSGSNIGIGTTNTSALLTIANNQWISSVDSAGTGLANMFRVNTSNQIEVGSPLLIGPMELAQDGGQMTFLDMQVTSAATNGTPEGYSMKIDGTSLLNLYATSNGAGGINTPRVGINNITPGYTLDITGDLNFTGDIYQNGVLFTGGGGADGLGVGNTGTANYITKWTGASTINNSIIYDNGTNVGIGLTNPTQKLSVTGNIFSSGTITASADIALGGGDIYDASGDLHVLAEDSLYLKMDLNNDDADIRNIIFAKNSTYSAVPTAAEELMRITEAGNVGIGVTAPTQKLHVNGSVQATSFLGNATTATSLAANGTNCSAGYYPLGVDASGAVETCTVAAAGQTLPSGTLGQTLRNDGTNWLATSVLYNTGTNVGVGITAPTSALDVNGSVNIANGQYYKTNTNNVLGQDGTIVKVGFLGVNTYFSADSSRNLHVVSNSNEFMTIMNTSGNVGIGTTNPTFKLQVYGSGANYDDGYIAVNPAGQAYPGILGRFQENNDVASGNSYFTYLANDMYHTNIGDESSYYVYNQYVDGQAISLSAEGFKFWYADAPANGTTTVATTLMRIKNDGNVGIGTTVPTAKLHVNGTTLLGGSTTISPLAGTGNAIVMADNNGALYTSAGMQYNRTAVSDVAYTVQAADYIVAYTSLTANRILTLPAALCASGRAFIITNETNSAFNVVVTPDSSRLISGETSISLPAYNSIPVYCNGTNWFIY